MILRTQNRNEKQMSTIQWTYCSCYLLFIKMHEVFALHILQCLYYIHFNRAHETFKIKNLLIFKVTILQEHCSRYEIPFPRNGLIWLAQLICQLDGSQVKFKLAFGKISLYPAFYMEYKLKMHSGIALRTKKLHGNMNIFNRYPLYANILSSLC